MFFALSKLLGIFTQPLSVASLCLLAACILLYWGKAQAGLRFAVFALAILILGGVGPLGSALLLPLENRFPRPELGPEAHVDGVIVLGGAENEAISSTRGTPAFNEASERMSEAISLARRFPKARIVFAGGTTSFSPDDAYSPDGVTQFYREQGLDMNRLTLESRSRNTHENAVFTKALIQPKPDERWLLVTSAFHMPRAVGCFRQAGWPIIPWPVDYRTVGSEDLYWLFNNPTDGFKRLDPAVKEWIGLIVYRLTGRTNAMLPGPTPR